MILDLTKEIEKTICLVRINEENHIKFSVIKNYNHNMVSDNLEEIENIEIKKTEANEYYYDGHEGKAILKDTNNNKLYRINFWCELINIYADIDNYKTPLYRIFSQKPIEVVRKEREIRYIEVYYEDVGE